MADLDLRLWPALAAALRRAVSRRPFELHGVVVGSVAAAHNSALQEIASVCGIDLQVSAESVRLRQRNATAAFGALNLALHASGHILGWRDEIFAVPDLRTLKPLATMERAAARFWGTLTFGAHATGFVRGADGRPSHLWIAQRSQSKATDPGLFDNLIGGGVPFDQSPPQALVREAFEEAGLAPEPLQGTAPMDGAGDRQWGLALGAPSRLHVPHAPHAPQGSARLGPADSPWTPVSRSVLRVHRDVPHGLQHEWLVCFDVELPPGVRPHNQDGEVAGFTCMPLAQAAAVAASPRMTVDASVVTLDFLLRHGLLPPDQTQELTPAVAALRVVPPRW
jgi:8-oxo-dGTP pyrophosphatase MutT (NUDIX family)